MAFNSDKLEDEAKKAAKKFKAAMAAYPVVVIAIFFIGRWSTWIW